MMGDNTRLFGYAELFKTLFETLRGQNSDIIDLHETSFESGYVKSQNTVDSPASWGICTSK